MNMKRKIRKAFKNATPYVLDRVAPPAKQDLPQQAYTPTEEETPAPKRNWRELVAMAAALALIIGSLASGVQFIRENVQFGPGQTAGVPTHAPSTNEPSGTIGVIDLGSYIISQAKEYIAPNDTANVVLVGDVSSIAIEDETQHNLTVEYQEYQYGFTFVNDGSLANLVVLKTDNSKTGYITPDAAVCITNLLLADQLLYSYPNIQLVDGIYHVDYLSYSSYGAPSYTYLVDATTGDVLANLDFAKHLDAALTYYGLSIKDCWHISIELADEGLPSAFVRFDLHCGTGVYVASVRLSSGAIIDNYILSTELPLFLSDPPAVDWQTARDTALANCAISMSQLTSLNIFYDPELKLYEFYFGRYPEEICCCVDAVTGEMTTRYPHSPYIGEEAAITVLAALLPEDVKTALLADADIEVNCSLYETATTQSYYILQIRYRDTLYEASVDALTGDLLDYNVTQTEPIIPPDGKIPAEYAIQQAINALVDEAEVKVFVRACSYVESDEGDYYLVDYFAGGCYYRVAVGAYGAGRLWHEGYDFEDPLNGFSDVFSALGTPENMALTHTYAGPNELRPYYLFYNGLGSTDPLTQEELDFVTSAGYTDGLDIIRLPADQVDTILGLYFGCTAADTNTAGLSYLGTTDCYYLWHSDALAAERFYGLGLIQDGDVYQMYYILQGDSQVYVLNFEMIGDRMVIYNNLPVEFVE